MTTAATITANLILDTRGFQKGVTEAGKATEQLKGKMSGLTNFIRQNGVVIAQLGTVVQDLGKKMTKFITLPIIAFFSMAIKKAYEADTAMGKLAHESMARLNEALAKLGEKFLPLFIRLLDFLTRMIDKFLAASPKMQGFILVIAGMIALAGPLLSFIGTILSVVGTLSALGVTLSGIATGVSTVGTALGAALLPLLPVLALIAAAVFLVWLVWSNWDTLKVTISQLWFIIKWEFKTGVDFIKEQWNETWKRFSEVSKFIQGETVFLVTRLMSKFGDFQRWVLGVFTNIGNAFGRVFAWIGNFANSVFQSIVNGINWVINAVNDLVNALANIVFPDEITPGSPTPFELGLKGIGKAMNDLSKQSIPQMNKSFTGPRGLETVGTGKTINIVDNRRFSSGMDASALRVALDDRFEGLTNALA